MIGSGNDIESAVLLIVAIAACIVAGLTYAAIVWGVWPHVLAFLAGAAISAVAFGR